jgi:hypothetical protein
MLNKAALQLGLGARILFLTMRVACGGVGQKVRWRLYREAGLPTAFCLALSVRATTNH